MVAEQTAQWKQPVRMQRLAWLALAAAVTFGAGLAAGSRLHAGGSGHAWPIKPAGPERVGPPPLSQAQADALSASATRLGATFVAYITGPVDPRIATGRVDTWIAARHRCDDAAQQDVCDPPEPEFPLTGAN